MERACFILRIRPGFEAEYDRRHWAIEDAFKDEMRANGVSDYTLFRRGRDVVGVLHCEPDAQTVLERGLVSPLSAAWAVAMTDVIEPSADPENAGVPFVEVWHLD